VATRTFASARRALLALGHTTGAAYARHELFHEMLRTLQEYEVGSHGCLQDAAVRCRDRTRRVGRPLGRYVVGRTLLLKGLEFDHALVFDANQLDRENLYVALTRASRSLTIMSVSPMLEPR
jgi:DNA helicase-2/ATP-dependent DNA helicase PcrA